MIESSAEKNSRFRRELFQLVDKSDAVGFKKLATAMGNDTVNNSRDFREGFEGKTLLHQATRACCEEIIKFLIETGHNIDPIDSSTSKKTPLMEAIENNHGNIAVSLVEAGASLSFQDINNENAFHYAARNGSSKLIKDIMNASNLSKEGIISLMSTSDIKRRFPEDLSKNTLARDALMNYRQKGLPSVILKKKIHI